MKCKSFTKVSSVKEALTLAQNEEKTVFLAGGTDVLVQDREDARFADAHILDIGAIKELSYVRKVDDEIHIGALVTHSELAQNDLILRHAKALALAAGTVGGPQIRNKGTLGGNLGNASPAADTLAPLVILCAKVVVQSAKGERILPLDEVVVGPYRNGLAKGELITEIRIQALDENYTQGFYKLARRNALAISRLTVAGAAKRNADGTLQDLRLSIGSVFPKPQEFVNLTDVYKGGTMGDDEKTALCKALCDKIPEIAGVRPTTAYKQAAASEILLRVLNTILGECNA